jgi:hypothetical protein
MDSDYSDPAAVIGFIFLVYGLIFLFSAVILIAYYVVMSIALSRLFRKTGIEGWIAWVPIYRTWKWLELGGQQGWLSLLSLVSPAGIVTSVFLYLGMYRTGIAFRKDAAFLILGIFLPFVWAFMLSSEKEQYHPEFITMAGYPPPLAGYGSVPRA